MVQNKIMRRDRNAKFIELANKRVNKTLKAMQLVGNLSNRSAYSYNDEQAKKIVRALQKELDIIKAKFGGTDNEGENIFKL